MLFLKNTAKIRIIHQIQKKRCVKFVNFENFPYICLRKLVLLGYLGAFIGGALAGAVIGLLVAPEKGVDTRSKITDAVDDFMKKHNIKLSRKQMSDLVDDIAEAAPEVED